MAGLFFNYEKILLEKQRGCVIYSVERRVIRAFAYRVCGIAYTRATSQLPKRRRKHAAPFVQEELHRSIICFPSTRSNCWRSNDGVCTKVEGADRGRERLAFFRFRPRIYIDNARLLESYTAYLTFVPFRFSRDSFAHQFHRTSRQNLPNASSLPSFCRYLFTFCLFVMAG